MSWSNLIEQAIGGYVAIEQAKAGAGMNASADQQTAIQSPTRSMDVQARAESMVQGVTGGQSPLLIGLGLIAVATVAYLALR
jgi:hypothetical protein